MVNDNAMEVACQLDEIGLKFHLNAILVLILCHIMSFANKILFNLSKAIRKICDHMSHLQLKNNNNN